MTSAQLASLTESELIAYLRTTFPELASEDIATGKMRGGRVAALVALNEVDPQTYERSRNFLTGAVTRLSPYLRHGVLSLAEVRDHALAQVAKPEYAGKLINELAWRDYWQRLYAQLGEGIWQDREAYKTGFTAKDYQAGLPIEVAEGRTTLVCIDSFAHDLVTDGYLHNHARMWMAAYVVHWLRVRWQAGARWFLSHLLDGDPASNNLSWQWVASTFASKAYLFNRENLERYTAGVYCRRCPHATAGTCPFEASYEDLSDQLFPRLLDTSATMPPAPPQVSRRQEEHDARPSPAISGKPLLWLHTDCLHSAWSPFTAHPQAQAVFVWDAGWGRAASLSLKRLLFLAQCLQEMPARLALRAGDIAAEVLAAARAGNAAYVIAQRTPDPRLQAAAQTLERNLPVVWVEPPAFAADGRAFDLKRFSRYWQRAQASAMQPTHGK